MIIVTITFIVSLVSISNIILSLKCNNNQYLYFLGIPMELLADIYRIATGVNEKYEAAIEKGNEIKH